MEPVLITVNEDRISGEQSTLDEAVPHMQAVYDAFSAQNIIVSVQEVANFKYWYSNSRDFEKALYDFISDRLLDKATPDANFGGVPIKREMLKSLIIMPDTTWIKSAIVTLANRVQGYNNLQIRTNLLVLDSGVIKKVADSDEHLTAEFTYHTKTDASAQLATDLLAIGQLLNNVDSKYKHYKINAPTGLVWRDGSFGLDLTAIRNYEAELSSGNYVN